jgi:tetratricopeptide (TPR) repeat protein
MELIERVSERERFLILDAVCELKNPPHKCIKNLQEFLEYYPDDEQGRSSLGAIYRNLEMWKEAEEQFRNVLKINHKHYLTYLNLAYIYVAQGMYDEAKDLLQENINIFPPDRFHRYMAHIFLFIRDYNPALAEVDKAFAHEPGNNDNIVLRGKVRHLKGDLGEAENAYRGLISSANKDYRPTGCLLLGHLYLLYGKFAQCKEVINLGLTFCDESELEEVGAGLLCQKAYLHLRLNDQQAALKAIKDAEGIIEELGFMDAITIKKFAILLKGWCYLEMNKMKEAQETAKQLYRLVEYTGNLKQMRLYYHLMGLICTKEGEIKKATGYFEKAIPLLPYQVNDWDNRAFYLAPLASAYYRSKNFEKAEELYKEIQSLTMGRLGWGDIFTRSFYWLGKINQQVGKVREAKAYYKEFLRLWKDADSGMPEIKDAEKQLAFIGIKQ